MKHAAVIITANAEFLIRQNLLNHAPLFDEVYVVDGPSLPVRYETTGNGARLTRGLPFSTDKTLEIVKSLCSKFPNIRLITRKTPWPGKASKFQEVLRYFKTGYIWQIDSDEFWFPKDVEKIKKFVEEHPNFTDFEFYARNFWGDCHHQTVMAPNVWGQRPPWRRIFRIDQGNTWICHEPPRLWRAYRENVCSRERMLQNNFVFHHYGYCHSSQFRQREIFYGLAGGQLTTPLKEWRNSRTESSVAGRLIPYSGPHPINVGVFNEEMELV
jgi:glycosyltransferase involved in cell wall biosynthesis